MCLEGAAAPSRRRSVFGGRGRQETPNPLIPSVPFLPVVGHQDIGVQGPPVLVRGLVELRPVVLVVAKATEARLPIVAALDDVLRNVRQVESGQAGHLASMRWVGHRVTRATCNGDRTRARCG